MGSAMGPTGGGRKGRKAQGERGKPRKASLGAAEPTASRTEATLSGASSVPVHVCTLYSAFLGWSWTAQDWYNLQAKTGTKKRDLAGWKMGT